MSKKVAILIADGASAWDVCYTNWRCQEAGLTPVSVGTQKKHVYSLWTGGGLHGWSVGGGQPVTLEAGAPCWPVECLIDSCKPNDFDALFIPSGCAVDWMRDSQDCLKFVKEMAAANKPCGAIGRGVALFAIANCCKGATVTGPRSIKPLMQTAGCEMVDKDCCHEKSFVTCRSSEDIPAFMSTFMKVCCK